MYLFEPSVRRTGGLGVVPIFVFLTLRDLAIWNLDVVCLNLCKRGATERIQNLSRYGVGYWVFTFAR